MGLQASLFVHNRQSEWKSGQFGAVSILLFVGSDRIEEDGTRVSAGLPEHESVRSRRYQVL